MKFKEILTGPRLILRQNHPTREIAEKIFQAVDECREYLKPFAPWERYDDSPESCLDYLKGEELKKEASKLVEYGIYIKENDMYIGNIQIFDLSKEKRSGEIGYWLAEKASGNGYMREAVVILEKECFLSLGLNRIQITCNELNQRSINVIKACGYVYEGTLREERYEDSQGGMRNTVIFSKLRHEYKDKDLEDKKVKR